MRHLCLLPVLALTLMSAAAEPKSPPDSPLGRKLAKLQKKFEADEAALKKKLAEARDVDEKQQVAFLLKELYAFTANDAVEMAEENKTDEAAIDACILALSLFGKQGLTSNNEHHSKAADLILEHHINNPRIAPALAEMVKTGPAGVRYLEIVTEKATNRDVQALAGFYYGLALDYRATAQEVEGAGELAARLRAEAIERVEKAVKLAPDARIGTESLRQVAARELLSLKIAVGQLVPDIEGTDVHGKKVKLSSFRGKVVLLDFWATWCGPCVALIPRERELVKKLANKPFVLLSVNVDEDKATLADFMSKEEMPWTHWWDGIEGPVSRMFRIHAFPTFFVIDAKGVLRKKAIGSQEIEAIDKLIDELVAEADTNKR